MSKYERKFLWIALPISLLAGFAATGWSVYQYAPLREIYPVCWDQRDDLREIPGRMHTDFFDKFLSEISLFSYIHKEYRFKGWIKVPYAQVDLNAFANFTDDSVHDVLRERRANGKPTPYIPGEELKPHGLKPTPSCAIVAKIAIINPDPVWKSR